MNGVLLEPRLMASFGSFTKANQSNLLIYDDNNDAYDDEDQTNDADTADDEK